jgi:hypothetical protein
MRRGISFRWGRTAVALALTLRVTACGDDGSSSTVDAGQDASTAFAERAGPGVGWTGDRLFVYGGNPPTDGRRARALGDAALVDLASGQIESLPAPPVEAPIAFPEVAVTSDHVVVLGLQCAERGEEGECYPATYGVVDFSLAEGAWRPVDLPEELISVAEGLHNVAGTTSDGRVVFELGAFDAEFGFEEFWTYAPETGEWQQLPSPGVRVESLCMADDTLVVATSTAHAGEEVFTPTDPRPPGGGEAYTDPQLVYLPLGEGEAGWTQTPPAPVEELEAPPSIGCGDDEAAVYDDIDQGVAIHPVGSAASPDAAWEVAPPAPAGFSNNLQVWTGEEIVWLDPISGEAAGLDPSSRQWRSFGTDLAGVTDPVWTGDGLAGWRNADGIAEPGPVLEEGS